MWYWHSQVCLLICRAGQRHPLTVAQLQERIRRQVDENADDNCQCWGQRGCYGATAAFFKLTLNGQGYMFVAKGVQDVHRDKLLYEAAIYQDLKALQGTAIPVCMAVVHLEEKYPLSSLAEITDLLLLSWAALTLYRYVMDRQLADEVECTELELEEAGVYDEDSREANLASNEE